MNTFYIIRLPSTGRFDSQETCAVNDVRLALQHATVNKAALRLATLNDLWKKEARIVRIDRTEIPGTTVRTVVHMTHINATKPCVLYEATTDMYLGEDERGAFKINDALIFSDLSEALKELVRYRGPATGIKEPKVFNVLITETPATTQEKLTVLE